MSVDQGAWSTFEELKSIKANESLKNNFFPIMEDSENRFQTKSIHLLSNYDNVTIFCNNIELLPVHNDANKI